MKHRLLSILITFLLLLSVCAVPFAEESATCEIYAEKISFCTEDGSAVTAESGAVLHAEANAEVISGGNYAFSILASDKGKLIAFETAYGTVDEDVTLVTPSITLPENVADVSVWAMLTDEELNDMLVPMAVLGSNEAAVSKITVGGIEVPLEEGKNEYDMTVYLKEENFPPEVKVYTRDLSSSVYISESEDGIYTYDITVESCNLAERNEYRLNVTAYEVTDASLIGISYDGNEIEDFTPDSYNVNVDIERDAGAGCAVSVVPYNKDAKIEITQAGKFPGTATIIVTSPDGEKSNTYTINFRKLESYTASGYSALTRVDGGWRDWNSTQGYQYVSSATEKIAGTSGKSNSGFFAYNFDLPSNVEIVEVTAKIPLSTTLYNVEQTVEFYQHYDPTLSQDDMIDPATGKFIINESNIPRFRGLNETDEYKLGEITINHTSSSKVTYEVSLDAEKINITELGNLIIMPKKVYIPENLSHSKSRVNIWNFPITVKYVVLGSEEENTVTASTEEINSYSLFSAAEVIDESNEEAELSPEIVWTTENGENIINIKVENEGGAEHKDEAVLVKMLREGINESDEEKTNFEKYAYFYMVYADGEGKAEHFYKFSDVTGTYKVVMKYPSMASALYGEIFVPSQQTLNGLLSDIASEEVSPEALAENMKTGVGELGLDGELYNKVTPEAQKNVAEYIKENIEESNIDGFVSAYEEAMLIKGISGAEASAVSEILTSYGEETQITENALYEEFDALTDSKKLEVYEMLSDGSYEDISGVEKALYGSVAAVKLRGISSFNDVGNIISSYGDYMGSGEEIAAYEALNRNLTDKVNLIMADELSSDDTLENILSKLDSAIAKAKKEAAQQASRPSGGGGGGKGGGFVAPPVTPPVSMEKIEESSAKNGFSDVPETHWGFEAITKLAEKKIISGRSESIFDPDAVITRAEFTKLAVSALGLYNENAACDFSDVDSSFWGYRYIASAVENKLVNGMDENKFGTALNISRQDAAVILYRAKGWEPVKTEEFADDGLIGDYAREALYSLKDKGILTGYENNIRPADSLTRAEAAQIIFKLLSI